MPGLPGESRTTSQRRHLCAETEEDGVSQADEAGRGRIQEGVEVKGSELCPRACCLVLLGCRAVFHLAPLTRVVCAVRMCQHFFLLTILHSFHQPSLTGPSACQALCKTLGYKGEGFTQCLPPWSSRLNGKQSIKTRVQGADQGRRI